MKGEQFKDKAVLPRSSVDLKASTSKTLKNKKKQRRQCRDRRSQTLIRKVYEISRFSNANIFLSIRFRDTSWMRTFYADSSGIWSSCVSQLVLYLNLCICKANKTRIHFILLQIKKRPIISLIKALKRRKPSKNNSYFLRTHYSIEGSKQFAVMG